MRSIQLILLSLVPLAACSDPPPVELSGPGESPDQRPPKSEAAPAIGASCAGLPATCGGAGDCCSSPLVTGGAFFRSYDLAGDEQSGSQSAPATLADFRLDKYEVTVGRFRRFVEAGMGTQATPPAAGAGAHANIAGTGWDARWNANLVTDKAALTAALNCDPGYQTWTDAAGANENRPINCVTWYEAMAFCAWDGGYLPTEAEWNFASAGGDQQRAYPWSTPAGSLSLDASHAVFYDKSPCGPGQTPCPGVVDVGTKPAGDGRFGQSDLAGNAWELTLDVYAYQYTAPCTNCATTKTVEDFHVMRGGSARDTSLHLRTARRQIVAPRIRARDIGFRCARAPQ